MRPNEFGRRISLSQAFSLLLQPTATPQLTLSGHTPVQSSVCFGCLGQDARACGLGARGKGLPAGSIIAAHGIPSPCLTNVK
jgi:hypothetical protein